MKHSISSQTFITATLLAVLLIGCSTNPGPVQNEPSIRSDSDQFQVELRNRHSFRPTNGFDARQIINIRVDRLHRTETLYLYKCGEPCSTAKKIQYWDRCCYPEVGYRPHVIKEGGRYYFWLQKDAGDGFSGPVFIENLTSTGSRTVVDFRSGSKVIITLGD